MKNGVAKLLGCVLAGCLMLGVGAGVLGAYGAGTGDDPLITYSYVQNVLLPKLKSRMTDSLAKIFSDADRSGKLTEHGKASVDSLTTKKDVDAVADRLVSSVQGLTAPSITEHRRIVIGSGRGIIASEGATVTVVNGTVNAVSEGNGSIISVKDKREYTGEKTLSFGDYVVVTEKGRVRFNTSSEAVIMVSGKVSMTRAETEGVNRVYGSDRYETAFKVADELRSVMGVEKFENIVVASGLNFADALSGSYLANVKNAPILLVHGRNTDTVKDYIRENLVSGGTVYILGGTAAVSDKMDSGLDGFVVKRLAGSNRYETNSEILKEAGTSGKDILVCTGLQFADGLSASAVNRPILLVDNRKLYDSQIAFLSENSGGRIYIVGGPNAISEKMENSLKAYGEVSRIYGDNRYDTSVNLAKEFYPDAKSAVVAYGRNFPDGLGGGCLAYRMSGPLILAEDSRISYAADYISVKSIKSGIVLGGSGLISDKATSSIFGLPENSVIAIK
ncbi:MAG: cell wall-binding repeat-containing protein [Clostridia bacterium]|nr:cell wall-binding repeat-containing protein [Clostridia bacterium]